MADAYTEADVQLSVAAILDDDLHEGGTAERTARAVVDALAAAGRLSVAPEHALRAAEAAEPPPDLEQVVDVTGSLRRTVAEQIGCPSCHTILNARAADCGDTWHWENRQQPEEQIEALRPDSSPKYGTCEQCGRVGYEVEVSCHTCHITLCPFCEHDCDEVPT